MNDARGMFGSAISFRPGKA